MGCSHWYRLTLTLRLGYSDHLLVVLHLPALNCFFKAIVFLQTRQETFSQWKLGENVNLCASGVNEPVPQRTHFSILPLNPNLF
jgi:hypothetical protein